MNDGFKKAEKPFIMICRDKEEHDVVLWFETEEELIWNAQHNYALEPYIAFEIGSKRDIPQRLWMR